MRQADWVAQRIDLPLAFAHAGMVLRLVVYRPAQRRGRGIAHKSIGIRIEKDHARLASDGSLQQFAQAGVLFGQRQIGPQLR